jgi:hypothetical protein
MTTEIKIPRLSETLNPLLWPHCCQRCGVVHANGNLRVWQEHDDNDQRELTFVILCPKCSDKLIEPHPRLYRGLSRHEPAPGIMAICQGCRHAAGGSCLSPLSSARGGPGLRFPAADGTVHIDYTDSRGRRRGRWERFWSKEPERCDGRESV